MPLQPHAQKELDEKLVSVGTAFVAGFNAGAAGQDNSADPRFEDFLEYLAKFEPLAANYATRELFAFSEAATR